MEELSETAGTRKYKRWHSKAAVVCLGLLSALLLVWLICLGVDYHLHVQVYNYRISDLTEERDRLNVSLDKITEELNSFQSLSKQDKVCPAGWSRFSCSCYFLSNQSDSWDKGREDCRDRAADLVVIETRAEQIFLSKFTTKPSWIGLNDREEEGSWKWVDGTPLTYVRWKKDQPDNGGGDPKWGEEDCAYIIYTSWNDLSCTASRQWICEKIM